MIFGDQILPPGGEGQRKLEKIARAGKAIRDLSEGRTRFCELERSLAGISPRTLSLRLRALEEEGIVERRTFPEVPPRVEYQLTPKGDALMPLIEDMRQYGREWLGVDDDACDTPAADADRATAAIA